MIRSTTTLGLAALILFAGCSTGKRDSVQSTSNSPPPVDPSGSFGTTPSGQRLNPADKGVQIGLQLLRSEITPAQAVTGWTAEGVTPQQAKNILGRLPLTAAFGPGTHASTITDAFGRSTDITVVVPATVPPADGYPVVVYLHGLGGNSSQVGGAALLPDTITVAPTALKPPASVVYEDAAPVPGLDAFQHWWVYQDHAFAMRALDWVRERYPVDTDRIVLYGASMGGFGTWNIGLRYHDRFAGLIVGAGGISRIEYAILPDTLSETRLLLENGRMVPSWFAHGTLDTVVPPTMARAIDTSLTGLAAPHTYTEVATAAHDSSGFAHLTGQITAWYDAARRNPSPTTVNHRAIGDYHLGAYWVELKGPKGTVQASAAGQTLTVTTGNGATGVTVYIDPNLVDVTAPVNVVVDSAPLWSGVPVPSLAAVAQSFARTRDPQLTYCYSVTTP